MLSINAFEYKVPLFNISLDYSDQNLHLCLEYANGKIGQNNILWYVSPRHITDACYKQVWSTHQHRVKSDWVDEVVSNYQFPMSVVCTVYALLYSSSLFYILILKPPELLPLCTTSTTTLIVLIFYLM